MYTAFGEMLNEIYGWEMLPVGKEGLKTLKCWKKKGLRDAQV